MAIKGGAKQLPGHGHRHLARMARPPLGSVGLEELLEAGLLDHLLRPAHQLGQLSPTRTPDGRPVEFEGAVELGHIGAHPHTGPALGVLGDLLLRGLGDGDLGHRWLLVSDLGTSIGGFLDKVNGLFWATYARRGARPRRPCPPRQGAARG